MAAMKMIFVIAILMALSITLTVNISKVVVVEEDEYVPEAEKDESTSSEASSFYKFPSSPNEVIRVSRFLADTTTTEKNPNAADHCHKDNEACYLQGRNGTVCCNNKCLDIKYNSNNCGACKNKCKYTEVCCRGQCVDTAYDKRHCGKCNSRCRKGEYCIYGMCDYA